MRDTRPLVLALPRGGVPVAAEIARRLSGDLDILLVKKIGAPSHPELAIGAIAEQSEPVWKNQTIKYLGLLEKHIEELAGAKAKEIAKAATKWRGDRSAPDVENRVVIVVDDGMATGATMEAALGVLKQRNPRRLIVALPVAPAESVHQIRGLVDEVVVLHSPENFHAVGQFYEDFTQVSDDEVRELLASPASSGPNSIQVEEVEIIDEDAHLPGVFSRPADMRAVIIFAHGSGSTHKSPRQQAVAKMLNRLGFGTLLFDLLTKEEAVDRANTFYIPLLAQRLITATNWLRRHLHFVSMPIGYFGASTGAAAALSAAAKDPGVYAVVSRGGRPDLAGSELYKVNAPTLLIVGTNDAPVLALNELANKKLAKSDLVTVEGATHLFEEPGAMEQVVEFSANWFEKNLQTASMTQTAPIQPREQVLSELIGVAKPLQESFEDISLFQRMARSRVVMLGEASHGTQEFYRWRREISQMLIEDHGFDFIAVEGDWPDCHKLDRYIRKGKGVSARTIMQGFQRWPTWMWSNYETLELIEWMKGREAGFYGLDVYSLHESLQALNRVALKFDVGISEQIKALHTCFEPYFGDEKKYARSLIQYPEGCASQALALLNHLLRTRLENTVLDEDDFLNARQNAKIIRNAEKYYRAMLEGTAESWNIRDMHMMDTLDSLLRVHGEGSKAIVWAHNTHIGDYHATDMLDGGYVNIGGLARERYGIENVCLVGFSTYEGQVLAAPAWDGRPTVTNLQAAPPGTYEHYLHRAAEELGCEALYLPLADHKLPSLAVKRGHRAVGVVYQENFENHRRNYVPTSLTQRYDEMIFIDKTTALKPLPTIVGPKDTLIPETWPAGV